MTNCMSVFFRPDYIVIKIKDEATRNEILSELKTKVQELKKFYKEEKTPILVTGKILKTSEIDEIQHLIEKTLKINVEFDSPRSLGLHGIKKNFRKEIATSETKFYKSSVRSGQKLEFEGSIVVLGDVNGGAEVIAGENIVVLGHLRGLAHAGAKGNKKAIIAAQEIDCPQIRISNIVREIEREEVETEQECKYAYIENDKIIME